MVSCKGKLGPGENSFAMQGQAVGPSNVVGVSNTLVGPGDKKLVIGIRSSGEEPEKKRARLDENIASGPVTSLQSTISDTISIDSGSEHLLAKNINALTNRNHVIVNVTGQMKASLGASHPLSKIVKPSSEDGPKSVFDIIVQHNIATQSKSFVPNVPANAGAMPMVYIPENNSAKGKKNKNAEVARNVRSQDPIIILPQNVNVHETAARIAELKQQAFEDWSRCLVPDANGNIPLHRAVINENLTLIKRCCVVLCARKATLDIQNNDKMTPLHLAVHYGNHEIVQMLLGFGAQPGVKDMEGNTALHLAVVDGNLECVKSLLNFNNSAALPLNDFNDEGYAPIHLCALRGKVEETKLLISKGAEVNLKDARSGRTPLFHAVEVNNRELVQLLLTFDASTNEPNFAGHTPLTAASEISFTTKQGINPDEINFDSKLVSLRSGEDLGHILEDNILIRGEIVEAVEMEVVTDGVGTLSNSSSAGNKNIWTSGD